MTEYFDLIVIVKSMHILPCNLVFNLLLEYNFLMSNLTSNLCLYFRASWLWCTCCLTGCQYTIVFLRFCKQVNLKFSILSLNHLLQTEQCKHLNEPFLPTGKKVKYSTLL